VKQITSNELHEKHTSLADSMLRGDIYCVFTSQETPLSVGLSFLFMPSLFTGVTDSSSCNNSSSSGARSGLTLGGLTKPVEKRVLGNVMLYKLP
jgi:hypothetical protein